MHKKMEMVDFVGFEKDTDFKLLSDAKFDDDCIIHIYSIEGEPNRELAHSLGLGIIQMNDGKVFLYDSMVLEDDEYDRVITGEIVKMGIYYQIENPDYNDTTLEILIKTIGFKKYLKEIMFEKEKVNDVINKLKDIFKSQKGKENNVIPFRKKG